MSCRGVASHVENSQTATGVKDSYSQYWIEKLTDWSREARRQPKAPSKDDIQKKLMKFVNEHTDEIYNPFLTLQCEYQLRTVPGQLAKRIDRVVDFDATQDTPVEILHTILLGVVKYGWHSTHSPWKDAEKALYTARLQSSDIKGLSIPPIRASYIVKYANSLIGRQFKILSQLNVFYVHDLVDNDLFELVKAIGTLSALLWIPEIYKMEEYLVSLLRYSSRCYGKLI